MNILYQYFISPGMHKSPDMPTTHLHSQSQVAVSQRFSRLKQAG